MDEVKLKEECSQLRLDLNKARHRLHQLEGSRILGAEPREIQELKGWDPTW